MNIKPCIHIVVHKRAESNSDGTIKVYEMPQNMSKINEINRYATVIACKSQIVKRDNFFFLRSVII